MKIYTASKTAHVEKWRALRREHEVTASWIDEAGQGTTTDYSELAARCITDIENADILLLYCEPGELLKGALIEAGIALAFGKEVRCVGECASLSRVFNQHPLWRHFATVQQALHAKKPAAQ
jgi:hypothetical protein